jgi:hypothetical protein
MSHRNRSHQHRSLLCQHLAASFMLSFSSALSFAADALVVASFSSQQMDVREMSARAPDLSSRVAAFLEISEARLLGNAPGRLPYLLAQYMTAQGVDRGPYTTEEKAWARKRLKDQGWAMAVLKPYEEEAQGMRIRLCPRSVDLASCYYYLLARDIDMRLITSRSKPQ